MSDLEGVLLSDYLLLQCVSKGGVADVYRARQNGEGEHEVAVKIFRPGYAQRESFRDYFMSEAEKVGQFDHPHILPLLEFGEGEGLLYVVAPFVKSGTLEDLLRRVGGRFPAMQALPIMQQLCSAVQYAHDREVIHGSIKPSNVFVAPDGRMLLADYCIARGYDDSQQSLTRIGWGSAEYAAPEQSLGVLRKSSDIYALGVLLFRILTGSPPFSGQTPVEVLLKHVRQPPPSARTLDSHISDAVDEVLRTALQKRSDDRFSSADEFSRALAAAVAIAPTASPVTRPVMGMVPQPALRQASPASDPQTPIPPSVLFTPSAETPIPPAAPVAPLPGEQVLLPPEPPAAVPGSGSDITAIRQQNFLSESENNRQDSKDPTTIRFWSVDPTEWSPVANEQTGNAGSVPLTASEYLQRMAAPLDVGTPSTAPGTLSFSAPLVLLPVPTSPPPAPLDEAGSEDKKAPRLKKLLPITVVALLLLGLLGALLSPLLFPRDNSTSTQAGQSVSPANPTVGTQSVASATPSAKKVGTATPGAQKTPVVAATHSPAHPTPGATNPPAPVFTCTSGSISLDGSANFQPAVQQLTADYNAQCNNSGTFNLNANGSKSSLDSLESGNIDLAYSDLPSAGRSGLVNYAVGGLLFAVAVNSDTRVTRLSTTQLQGIYTGKITNWSQVGGTDEAVQVITRPSDSAIRAVFEWYVLKGSRQSVGGISLWSDSTGAVAQKIVDTSGSISYIPVAAVPGNGAQSIAINGVSPVASSLASGAYPFWTVEHLYTNQAATGLEQSFIVFCSTTTGSNDLASNGVVPMRRIAPAALNAHGTGPMV
ncbi:MAG: protein kinase [Chloroflexota bacterium]|nr:protein kinase [Chloroflexota bacterium]